MKQDDDNEACTALLCHFLFFPLPNTSHLLFLTLPDFLPFVSLFVCVVSRLSSVLGFLFFLDQCLSFSAMVHR